MTRGWNIFVVVAVLLVVAVNVRLKVEKPVLLSFEAEKMRDIVSPMRVVEDRLASGFKALEIPTGVGRGWCGEAGGMAVCDSDIPQSDTYTVWLRVKWQDGCQNAVYLQIDNGHKITVGNDAIFNVWHWVKTEFFTMDRGKHKLTLSNHSPGIKIDKLEITNDPRYTPADYGHEVSSFFDGFGGCDGQNSGSWTVVSGDWTVIRGSAENVRATSDTFAQTRLGVGLAIAHQLKWKECDIESYLMSTGQGYMGLVFSYVNKLNYFLLEWGNSKSTSTNTLRFYRVSGGKKQLIAEGGKGYRNDAWHVLGVRCNSDCVDVRVDAKTVLSVTGLSIPEGHVGLFTRDNELTYFDNVKVVALAEGKPIDGETDARATNEDRKSGGD